MGRSIDAASETALSTVSLEANAQRDDVYAIVVVADLDKQSRERVHGEQRFVSYLQHASLSVTRRGGLHLDEYAVSWDKQQKFSTTVNDAGRGFELSELAWFNGKLLTFDDRTGIVYHLKNFASGSEPLEAVPMQTITEGDGSSNKAQKHEWATVRRTNNLWVAVLDAQGNVRREDWTSNYARVRKALNCEHPGYVTHEAIEWSAIHRKWFILPRRVSQEAYDKVQDEQRGSNKLVIASEDFSSIEVITVGKVTPLRGFSSFKFVPRTDDSVIVAIKSVEVEASHTQASYLTVFDIHGNVLLEETELPGGYKYEGVAFAKDWNSFTDSKPNNCCVVS